MDPFYFLKKNKELTFTFQYENEKKNILISEQKLLNELNKIYKNKKTNKYLILNIKQLLKKYNEINPIRELRYYKQQIYYNFPCIAEVIELNIGDILFNVNFIESTTDSVIQIKYLNNITVILDSIINPQIPVNIIINSIESNYNNISLHCSIFCYDHIFTNPLKKTELIPCIYQFFKISDNYNFIDNINQNLTNNDIEDKLEDILKKKHPLNNIIKWDKNQIGLEKLVKLTKDFRKSNLTIKTDLSNLENEEIYYLNFEYDLNKINLFLKNLFEFQFVLIIHIPGMIETISNCFIIPYKKNIINLNEDYTLNDYIYNTFNKYIFELENMNKYIENLYDINIKHINTLYTLDNSAIGGNSAIDGNSAIGGNYDK